MTRTVVFGLLLAFLLFTPQGREIGLDAFLVVFFVGAAALSFIRDAFPTWPLNETVANVFAFLFLGYMAFAAVAGIFLWTRRVDRERREQAMRLIVLRDKAIARHFSSQPLDGEILPAQRYLSP